MQESPGFGTIFKDPAAGGHEGSLQPSPPSDLSGKLMSLSSPGHLQPCDLPLMSPSAGGSHWTRRGLADLSPIVRQNRGLVRLEMTRDKKTTSLHPRASN